MASFLFNSAIDDNARALIDLDTDIFKVMLATSVYVPNKDTHTKRSDVTNEVVGTGYVAGGNTATVTVTKDIVNDRVDVVLGGTTWPASTITARYAIYYKSRGGAATADELVAVVDFVTDVTSTADTFTLTASTWRKSNP